MFWELFAVVFVIAALSILVRPSSNGPAFVADTTSALAQLITYSVAG